MKELIEFISKLIANFIQKPLDYTAEKAEKVAKAVVNGLIKLVTGFVILLLCAICVVLISLGIFSIPATTILFIIIILGIIHAIKIKAPAFGSILFAAFMVAVVLLTFSTYAPGWKSTLASNWNFFDNNSFFSHKQGEKIKEEIQNGYKSREEQLKQDAIEKIKNNDQKGALDILGDYVADGESLKHQIDSINALRNPNPKKEEQIKVKQVIEVKQVIDSTVYGKPHVEKLGPNKVRVHFLPNGPVDTKLTMKLDCDIKYTNVTAPFQVLWTDGQYRVFYDDYTTKGKKNDKPIVVHGFTQPGSVDVEVVM